MNQRILALILMILMLAGCSGSKTEQFPTTEPTLAAINPESELGSLITLPADELSPTTTATPVPSPVVETVPAASTPPAIIITKYPASKQFPRVPEPGSLSMPRMTPKLPGNSSPLTEPCILFSRPCQFIQD